MRRGHKRMELVRIADRKRRRADERPVDEVYLSRRMFVFKGMFALGFGALVARLGKMQVVDSHVYAGQAEGNTIRPETLNTPRGLIVDRKGQILAENRISWTVSITPAQLPDDNSQLSYIRTQLIDTLGLKDQLVVRRSGLPLGSEDYVLTGLAEAIGADPPTLIKQIRIDTDDLVIVRKDLSADDAARFRDLERKFPGVHVMNRIDYLLELHAGEPTPVTVQEDVPREVALALEANPIYLPGVMVTDDKLVRQYPAGPEFSHILGYVGPITKEEYDAAERGNENPYLPTDVVGRGGIEEAMEKSLRGTHGLRWVMVDARGVEMSELENRRVNPTPGYTVELTIDRDFQQAVTAALQEGIQKANEGAKKDGKEPVGSGVAVALDPQTGEVLALVSLPTFDNQRFVDGISEQDYQAYLNDSYKPLTNFAISGAFPPGSTLKPLLACAALQEKVVTTTTEFRCAGIIRVPTVDNEMGGNNYVCWNPAGHGQVAIHHAIADSCDVYFYNVAAPGQTPEGATQPLHYYIPGDPQPHYFGGLGIDKIDAYLKDQFGFGKPTGIELAAEAAGLVPDPKWLFQSPLREYWSVGDTINVSIGQGYLTCTPLQLVCGIASIANGGTYFRPRLVRSLRDAGGQVVRDFTPEKLWSLAVDKANVEVVREGMRLTVTDGTSKGKFTLTGNDFPMGGKTGTAEFGEAVDGKYKRQHAWYAAFAPYDSPKIAVIVLIQSGGEGATYAVPVADAILAAYFGKGKPTA